MVWLAALPNLLAMLTALVAVVLLGLVIRRLGGQLGAALKLIGLGVFLSVFLHAGAELAEVFGLLAPEVLTGVMALLLTTGSLAFCAGSVMALRALR